ncbi:acetyl-CoA hydrolase/transferase family protein [Pullulanibacillus camelliae]|nr:acetyl-CoA hydrolase/transferase family protein [Pullulanibacillus camelliae]
MTQWLQKSIRPNEVFKFIHPNADIIVGMANGEPLTLLNTLEAEHERLQNVRFHQMHPRNERAYINGQYKEHMRHIAYFLSPSSRDAYNNGHCDLVPNHFHEVPKLLREHTACNLVIASAAPMDHHGYFSLGTNAEYVAALIGQAPFLLEINPNMPRTYGGNQIHISQIVGFIESDNSCWEIPAHTSNEIDQRIAGHIAALIPDGSTIQVGIGGIPNAIIGFLKEKKHLGIHTEMLTDGLVDLVESGAVDGTKKQTHPGKIVGTFALGTKRLYSFLHENTGVLMLPVDVVNDPRLIAKENHIVSINSSVEVDFFGQCSSETIQGRYYSSTGGQADFARGAAFAENGKSFICLPSTAKNGTVSRIQPYLTPGTPISNSKNDVHYIVTEFGAANLKGKSIRERALALISIAHPRFREELTFQAQRSSFI